MGEHSEENYARAKALIADLKAAGLIRGPLPEEEYLRLWDIALRHTQPSDAQDSTQVKP